MLSSRPVIQDHPLASTYEVRSDNAAFAAAILEGALATWLTTGRDKFPPMSFELGSDWLLGYAPQLTVELFPELLDGVLGFRDRISPDVVAAFGRSTSPSVRPFAHIPAHRAHPSATSGRPR